MIFNKNENSINWDTINVKLDFNNDNENNPDNIKYLGYINQNSATPAIQFLGVFIDPQLNFKYHKNFLRKKNSCSFYFINRVKHILCNDALLTLFHSFVNSPFIYCLQAWSCGLESSISRLIILQKKALRILTWSRYNSHTAHLFKDLKILPL